MKQKYFIGFDGGGTKTKCIITDYQLNPLFECQGGPSNFLIIGTQIVSQTILDLISQTVNSLNISYDQIESMLIGTTGAGRPDDAQKLKNDFISYAESKGHKFKSFNVESDARIALEGAFSGKPGSLLIAGTGSMIIGKDRNNNFYRAGGFGKFIGDEGSGNALGRKGLIQIAKDFDGRGGSTELTKLLERDSGINNSSQLITEVYRNNFDLASFAPKVIEAAENGDKSALKILDEESDELVLHVKSMFKMINEENMKLCLVGGTIATENYYSDLFKSKIKNLIPEVSIVKAENSPAMGAAYMAKSISLK